MSLCPRCAARWRAVWPSLGRTVHICPPFFTPYLVARWRFAPMSRRVSTLEGQIVTLSKQESNGRQNGRQTTNSIPTVTP